MNQIHKTFKISHNLYVATCFSSVRNYWNGLATDKTLDSSNLNYYVCIINKLNRF